MFSLHLPVVDFLLSVTGLGVHRVLPLPLSGPFAKLSKKHINLFVVLLSDPSFYIP